MIVLLEENEAKYLNKVIEIYSSETVAISTINKN